MREGLNSSAEIKNAGEWVRVAKVPMVSPIRISEWAVLEPELRGRVKKARTEAGSEEGRNNRG